MSNALAIIPVQDVERMAIAMAKSGLFGFKTPDQAMAMMLVAQAEGLHPATAVQDYDIIQGKPTRKTNSVLARFQAAGGVVQWHDFTENVVSGTFSHSAGGSLRVEWTMEMAKKAGLSGKETWQKTPRAMLRARCIAEGVRAVYPAAIGGSLTREEALDIAQPEKPVKPEPKNMGDAEIVVELNEITARINAAKTIEELEAIRPDIRRLRGDDKQKALAVAKYRGEQIRAVQNVTDADPETGEILPPAEQQQPAEVI